MNALLFYRVLVSVHSQVSGNSERTFGGGALWPTPLGPIESSPPAPLPTGPAAANAIGGTKERFFTWRLVI